MPREISFTGSQTKAVLDTKDKVLEGNLIMSLSGSKTLGTYSTAMCESQSISFGDNEVVLCGRKMATLEEDLVMSFSAETQMRIIQLLLCVNRPSMLTLRCLSVVITRPYTTSR